MIPINIASSPAKPTYLRRQSVQDLTARTIASCTRYNNDEVLITFTTSTSTINLKTTTITMGTGNLLPAPTGLFCTGTVQCVWSPGALVSLVNGTNSYILPIVKIVNSSSIVCKDSSMSVIRNAGIIGGTATQIGQIDLANHIKGIPVFGYNTITKQDQRLLYETYTFNYFGVAPITAGNWDADTAHLFLQRNVSDLNNYHIIVDALTTSVDGIRVRMFQSLDCVNWANFSTAINMTITTNAIVSFTTEQKDKWILIVVEPMTANALGNATTSGTTYHILHTGIGTGA